MAGPRPSALRRLGGAPRPSRAAASRYLGQLRGPAWRSAVRALADGVFVIGTLETRGVRPLARRQRRAGSAVDPARATQVAAAVDAALGVLPASPSCLRRSVTLLRELDRLGLAATLHIGVRKAGDEVEAHAWVQAGDVVVNDDPAFTGSYGELAAGDLEQLFPLLR